MNSKKPQYKKKVYKKKAPSTVALSKRIKAIEHEIELKAFDTYNVSTSVTTSGTQNLLNAIGRNVAEYQRIGNQIKTTSVQIKLSAILNTLSLVPNTMRLIVFWDRQCNNGLPTMIGAATVPSVLDSDYVTEPILMPYNINSRDRYTILYDKMHVIGINDIVGGFPVQVRVNINKYIKASRMCRFDDAGTTVASITTNALYCWYVTDQGANGPNVKFASRVYYKDA